MMLLTHEERVENRREIDELAAEICTMAGHMNAANYRWLTLIAEFDRRKGWSDNVTQSCAHWLNWKCGIDIGAAREWVRVAHAIGTLPKIAAAMQRGQVSYSKVRDHACCLSGYRGHIPDGRHSWHGASHGEVRTTVSAGKGG